MNELGAANKRLSDVNKELMDANEELQVANEELVLTHEELQASIEEFETTNEELQATNEELETTNDELRARTGELQELATILEAERGRLAEMVELAPFYILVLHGPSLTVEAYNPRYARLLESRPVQGRPLDEVIDLFWEEGLEIVHLARDAYRLDEVRTTHRVLTHLVSPPSQEKKLQERYFSYTVVPSHDPAGKVDGVIIYALDETEERFREVEEEREQLRLIFNNLAQTALALFDAQTGELLIGSPRYLENVARATGIEQDELIGRPWQEITFLSSPEQARHLWQQVYQEQKPVRLPELIYNFPSNGPEVVWDYTLTPLLDSQHNKHVHYILVSLVEITEQVQARHHLEQVDTLRDDFISLATHELRGPLTTLKGNAQLLQKALRRQQDGQKGNPGPPQENILLEQILHQTERMNRMIGEMFDVASLRNQAFELQREEDVDLIALSRHVIEAYTTQGRKIDLHTDERQVRGNYDADRIEQVIQNLLSNAMKYSPAEKTVQVTIEKHAGEVVVSVQDNGNGIASADVEHIFDRFYRAQQMPHEKKEGLGLGLYVAHEIIVQHGGRMWVESQPGQGSTFFFSLPLP